ncbi:signal peptidase I [Vibrio cholerae]|jgi:hypothetical protein|nr:signal peptidase I [Vibrio cholerae]
MTLTSVLATGMLPAMTTTTTTTDPAIIAGILISVIIGAAIGILITGFSLMKMFTKAGRSAWEAFVPFYNIIVLLQISGLSPWLILLSFIPGVNIVLLVLLAINVAKVFGKGVGIAVLGFFLPVISYFVLSYSDARYLGRDAARYPLGQAPDGFGAPGAYQPAAYQPGQYQP